MPGPEGMYIAAEEEAIDSYVREIAMNQHTIDDVEKWLLNNSKKLEL